VIHCQVLDNNEKYDADTNKWTSQEPMPTARHGLAAVVVNDGQIYVIGGGREPGGLHML
jgi:N-acetylneuraminic acid mutarotase